MGNWPSSTGMGTGTQGNNFGVLNVRFVVVVSIEVFRLQWFIRGRVVSSGMESFERRYFLEFNFVINCITFC